MKHLAVWNSQFLLKAVNFSEFVSHDFVDSIEVQVESAQTDVAQATVELEQAKNYQVIY